MEIFPEELISVLQAMSIDKDLLSWNIQRDSSGVNLNLNWKPSKAEVNEYSSVQRKSTYTIRRDRKRMDLFMKSMDMKHRSDSTNWRQIERENNAEAQVVSKVSTLLTNDTIKPTELSEKPILSCKVVTKSVAMQTGPLNTELTAVKAVQTDSVQKNSSCVQTDLLEQNLSVRATQTEKIQNAAVSIQTAVAVSVKSVQTDQELLSSDSTFCDSEANRNKNTTTTVTNKTYDTHKRRNTESVLKIRGCGPNTEYLVKWKGLGHRENSWVSADDLDNNARAYIREHHSGYKFNAPKQAKFMEKIIHVVSIYTNDRDETEFTVRFASGRTGMVKEFDIPYHVRQNSQFYQD